MRIISGKLRSRKLSFPKSKATRPMTDRGRETVFDILGGLVFGKQVLDLYAGSGSLGFEALSRGALHATFVDQASFALKAIQKNAADLRLEDQVHIIRGNVLRVIGQLKKKNRYFSLIFVDPPFQKGWVKKTLLKLDQSGIVLPFGQIVVGHARQEELPESLPTLRLVRTKRIGQACLSFLFRMDTTHGETKSYISGEL